MWSVAMTDFFQMIIIMVGMVIVGYYVTGLLPDGGGVMTVVSHAAADGKLNPFPALTIGDAFNYAGMFAFVSALLTLGFGSIPQQDVFQRVMSSKDENTAQNSAVLGGSLYFLFAFVPIFLAYSASLIDPAMVGAALGEGGDTQLVLPNLILSPTPVFVQVMFFGALLSAIMSTASGTLLAPSTMFVENILKPFFKEISDKQLLRIIKGTVIVFTVFVTLFALSSETSIFGMVENAYKITLAGAVVPLAF
jgi:Na+/proline symporter